MIGVLGRLGLVLFVICVAGAAVGLLDPSVATWPQWVNVVMSCFGAALYVVFGGKDE